MRRLVHAPLPALLALSLVAPTACDTQATEEGPELPPLTSMQFDLGGFGSAEQSAAKGDSHEEGAEGAPPTGAKAHFNNAAGRVAVLNVAIGLHLLFPTAAFAAALSQEPRFEDGEWIYDFSFQHKGDDASAVLHASFTGGAKEGTKLHLEMHFTCLACAVPTDDFIWYTGDFELDGQSGQWVFFGPEIEGGDQRVVRVDYAITDDTHKSLTFTNIRTDGHENAGDIVGYERDGDIAAVSAYDANEALDFDIQWSLSETDGSIEVPGYNGGDKACWDADHMNVECP